MVHRLLFIFLLSVCTLTANSTPVRIQKLRQSAASFLGKERAEKLKLVELTEQGFQRIALLNSDEAGYAVINIGSLEAPEILAYGTTGLDLENLSPEFVWIMEQYEQALSKGYKSPRRANSFEDVPTLLTTHWAQSSPYNDMTPVYEGWYGNHTLTGCVATAYAQVLKYWELPKTMHGSKTYGFTNDYNQRITLSFDYSHAHFDWANMLDSYKTSVTDEQRKAVATLMYACGVATNMKYGYSASGANTWHGADAINCFFDGLRAEGCDFDLDIIAAELKARRPVVYSGSNGREGHCFVIDGSTSRGYLHCNLGWGSMDDGYFLPTDMAGYSSGQSIVRIYPSDYRPAYQPLPELQAMTAHSSLTPITEVEPNRWYVLWNAGRAGSPCSTGKGQTLTNTSSMPTGERTEYCGGQLVRFVPNTTGNAYYIQTGLGDYFGAYRSGESATTLASRSALFSIGSIQDGYFWIKSGSCYIDTNGPGSTVVGWGNTQPTDTVSNSSWRLYPVTLYADSNNVLLTDIQFTKKELALIKGSTMQLTPELIPSNASIPVVTWRSTKPSVATVDAMGQVKALARGFTNIIASSVDGSEIKDTISVTVLTANTVNDVSKLRNNVTYLLKNTGQCQGSLVCTSPYDTTPTLRGVEMPHPNGMADKLFAEEVDLTSEGSYWQIIIDGTDCYLYNLLAESYLIRTLDGTGYEFTGIPTPLRYGMNENGSFWFADGEDDTAYLCAATPLISPAYSWKQTDSGSEWSPIAVQGHSLVPPTPIVGISHTSLSSSVAPLYDLRGRKCHQAQPHGIYIQGGQKRIYK